MVQSNTTFDVFLKDYQQMPLYNQIGLNAAILCLALAICLPFVFKATSVPCKEHHVKTDLCIDGASIGIEPRLSALDDADNLQRMELFRLVCLNATSAFMLSQASPGQRIAVYVLV